MLLVVALSKRPRADRSLVFVRSVFEGRSKRWWWWWLSDRLIVRLEQGVRGAAFRFWWMKARARLPPPLLHRRSRQRKRLPQTHPPPPPPPPLSPSLRDNTDTRTHAAPRARINPHRPLSSNLHSRPRARASSPIQVNDVQPPPVAARSTRGARRRVGIQRIDERTRSCRRRCQVGRARRRRRSR